MPKLSAQEKLLRLEKQIEQLNEERNSLLKAEKERTEKERRERLLTLGSLSESYFNWENMSINEFEDLLKTLLHIGVVKRLLPPNIVSNPIDILSTQNTMSEDEFEQLFGLKSEEEDFIPNQS